MIKLRKVKLNSIKFISTTMFSSLWHERYKIFLIFKCLLIIDEVAHIDISKLLSRFSLHIQEKDEMDLRPVFTEEGITYVYIKVCFSFCDHTYCLVHSHQNVFTLMCGMSKWHSYEKLGCCFVFIPILLNTSLYTEWRTG